MKRFALLIVAMVCLSLTSFAADAPAGDVFGGFSIVHVPSVTSYGWQASGAYNVTPMLGVVGDFGGQYKSGSSAYEYLFGPRYNVRQEKVTYFVHALFGGTHAEGGGNAFAMGYGGGVDVMAGKLTVRVIQFDWIPEHISGGGWFKKTTRYGFGVVMPFGKK